MWDWVSNQFRKLKAKLRDFKFNSVIKAILFAAVIVSFSHTMELYSTVGFNRKLPFLNKLFGVDWITEAFGITFAAELAFMVGIWRLQEEYFRNGKRFPKFKNYWQEWVLLCGGFIIVWWSNVSASIGYNWFVGQPYKGLVLGTTIPLFTFGAILVNFKRTDENAAATETPETEKTDGVLEKIWRKIREKIMPPTPTITFNTSNSPEVKAPEVKPPEVKPEEQEKLPEDKPEEKQTANISETSRPEDSPEVKTPEEKPEDMEDMEENKPETTGRELEKKKSTGVKKRARKGKGEELQRAIEHARRILQEEGELPGRDRLKEEAGVSEWIARRALAELKKAS